MMIATHANMRIAYAKYGNRVVMLDVMAGETYSANPDDYFYVPDDHVFGEPDLDEPNVLVVPYSGYYELSDDGNIMLTDRR